MFRSPYNLLKTTNTARLTEIRTLKLPSGYEIDVCHNGRAPRYVLCDWHDNELGVFLNLEEAEEAARLAYLRDLAYSGR